MKALISMFYNYEELARNEEKKTDAILEGENAEKPPTNAPQKVHEDFIEETISQCMYNSNTLFLRETYLTWPLLTYYSGSESWAKYGTYFDSSLRRHVDRLFDY